MDRESLEEMLSEGLSLEEIGRRLGKHHSTVSYWLRKHGLTAVNSARHAPRGGVDPERLRELVQRRLSVRELARELGVSYSTTRYWLKRHGLATLESERHAVVTAALAEGRREIELTCATHGLTRFILEGRGYFRCARCRAERVALQRRRVKARLLSETGERCQLCGYDKTARALHFHHVDPTQKEFGLSANGAARSLRRAREEAAKCVLLCANCHAEVEAGVATVF
jgi:transposase-like protein